MSYETIGIIAGVLALVGYIPYIYSIFKGITKPNRATWIIWTIVGGLLAFSYAAEGDSNAIWLPIGYFVGPLIVAILSIWYGYTEWTRVDKVCLLIAIISIVPWVLSKDATITLVINVLIDASGAIPTLVKTYKEPETEDLTAWAIFAIANTLQLFALSYLDITVLYPAYLFFLATGMVVLILRGRFLSPKTTL